MEFMTIGRKELLESIQKFIDFSQDLLNAKYGSFETRLNIFIRFCESNNIISVITGQLKSYDHYTNWKKEFDQSGSSMVGSGKFQLPSNDDDRLSLLYQILLKTDKKEFDVSTFEIMIFGGSDLEEAIHNFNNEITRPFVRDLTRRLNDIKDDAEKNDYQQISQDHLKIIKTVTSPQTTIIEKKIQILKFENFRGIKKGEIKLGKLTILVGPNNSAKSTILEGLFLLPNPLRHVPYYNANPDFRKDFTAATIIHDVHKMGDSKGYLFLFHGYYISEDALLEWEDNFLRFIKDNTTIYLSTKNQEGIFQTKKVNIRGVEYDTFGELGISSEQSRGDPSTENENKLIASESLLISSEFIKFAYSYLERNWDTISKHLMSKIIKDISESVNEDFVDIILERFSYNIAITGYRSDGIRIRLSDLGYGMQLYLIAKILYEIKQPKILLWDDIESHLNPRIIIKIGEWFSELIENGIQIVVSTHSLETLKLITEFNNDATICMTFLEDGILKYREMSIEEVDKLLTAGVDIRLAEKEIL